MKKNSSLIAYFFAVQLGRFEKKVGSHKYHIYYTHKISLFTCEHYFEHPHYIDINYTFYNNQNSLAPLVLTNYPPWPMLWKVTFPDWLSFLVSAGEKTRKTQLNDTFLLFGSKQMEGFYLGYNINRGWDWWKWINRHTIWT